MKVFWDYELKADHNRMPEVALYFDNQIIGGPRTSHKYNIAIVCCEPFEIIGHEVEKYLLRNWIEFDLILTDKFSLLTLPNAKIFIYADPWMINAENKAPVMYGASTLIGHKMWTVGHRFRHILWDRRNEIYNIPKYFFSSQHGGPPSQYIISEYKDPLFEYQYHICIENTISDYYITEKIIDCFRMNVVPIYIGAKKIGDFFDERGIFEASNIDDVISICNELSSKKYESMKKFVRLNRSVSNVYANFGERLVKIIEQTLGLRSE